MTLTRVFQTAAQSALTLQFGNGAHRSYGPAMRKSITVTVAAAP